MNGKRERLKVVLVDCDGEPIPDWVREELDRKQVDLTVALCGSRDDLEQHAADADVVWMFGGSRILQDGNLAAVPRCWAILRTGSGTDNVPVDEATRRRIVVANTPTAHNDAVADHTIALLLAAVRRIGELDRGLRAGRWLQGQALPLNSVQGRTLGLVGFGHIARLLVRKLSGFDMNVLVHDPWVAGETIVAQGAKPADLDALLSQSDYVSLHCPLTDKTRRLIGERELNLMKPTAVLVNTSRGPVVDEQALIRALNEGRIAAAGLDVFEDEPPKADNPLLRMENVVLTPHGAGYSADGVALRWRISVETIVALAEGRWPPSCVNCEVRPQRELVS